MKVIMATLIMLGALAGSGWSAPSNDGLNEKCQPAPNDLQEWKKATTYNFSYLKKSYQLIWSRTIEGGGSLCLGLARGKMRPIATQYTNEYMDKVDRVSAKVFNFQIHEGNGGDVPHKLYRLDLSDPERPKVKLIKRWIE
jgi:hypothetical protein